MPRGKKTQSGDPAQKVESVTGQRYGEGVAQEQMQKAMPAPNAQRTTQSAMAPSNAPAPQQPQQAPQPQQPAPRQPVDVGQFLQQLPKNLLAQQDQRPVTSGLPFGPGNNDMPNLRTPANRLNVDMLQRMFDMTGNPRIRSLLERARN